MSQITIKNAEDAAGLAEMLKEVIDANLKDPRKERKIRHINADCVLELTDMDVAVTIKLRNGAITIEGGKTEHPKVYLGADFLTITQLSTGVVSPIKAVREKKLTIKGDILLLLKLQSNLLSAAGSEVDYAKQPLHKLVMGVMEDHMQSAMKSGQRLGTSIQQGSPVAIWNELERAAMRHLDLTLDHAGRISEHIDGRIDEGRKMARSFAPVQLHPMMNQLDDLVDRLLKR